MEKESRSPRGGRDITIIKRSLADSYNTRNLLEKRGREITTKGGMVGSGLTKFHFGRATEGKFCCCKHRRSTRPGCDSTSVQATDAARIKFSYRVTAGTRRWLRLTEGIRRCYNFYRWWTTAHGLTRGKMEISRREDSAGQPPLSFFFSFFTFFTLRASCLTEIGFLPRDRFNSTTIERRRDICIY